MKVEYKKTDKFTDEVIDEIMRIHKEQGLTAENLIKNAKKKSNPLHELFDWDIKSSAEKWWLYQARVLINEVKVILGDLTKKREEHET